MAKGKTMTRATRIRKGCWVCGGTRTINAVDNHGKPYQACATCRIMSLPDIRLADGSAPTAPTREGGT